MYRVRRCMRNCRLRSCVRTSSPTLVHTAPATKVLVVGLAGKTALEDLASAHLAAPATALAALAARAPSRAATLWPPEATPLLLLAPCPSLHCRRRAPRSLPFACA